MSTTPEPIPESALLTGVAASLAASAANLAVHRRCIRSVMPVGKLADAIDEEMAEAQRHYLRAAAQASDAAVRRCGAGCADPDVPHLSMKPEEPDLVPGTGVVSLPYWTGQRIEYRHANETEWRDGVFGGYSADGSGNMFVRACGTDYRCSPENVRTLAAETVLPAPAPPRTLDRS